MAFKKSNKVPQWNVDYEDENSFKGQRRRAIDALKRAKEIEAKKMASGKYEWVEIEKGEKLVKIQKHGK